MASREDGARDLVTFFLMGLIMIRITAACSWCLWTSFAFGYDPPTYPQTPSRLSAIALAAPKTAQAGASIPLEFRLTASRDLAQPTRLFAYFAHDGRVYHVDIFPNSTPKRSPAVTTLNRPTVLGPFRTALPANLPMGEYEITAGVYGEVLTAKATILIEAPRQAQPRVIINTGTFTDKLGVPHRWHVNEAHTLFWDGEPWFPVGGMCIPDNDFDVLKAQLDLLRKFGVRDIYFNVGNAMQIPHTWETKSDESLRYFQKVIDYMDEIGMRYGMQTSGLEAKGYAYDLMGGPEAEIEIGVNGSPVLPGKHDDKAIKDGDLLVYRRNIRDAFYVVGDVKAGTVVAHGEGRIEHDERPGEKGERRGDEYKVVRVSLKGLPAGKLRVSLCVAERRDGWNQNMYYWGGQFDAYAAKMRELYGKVRMGPGFRFGVDVFWNENNMQHGMVPSDQDYRDAYAKYLERRYKTIDALHKAWAVDDPATIDGFEQAARLLPIRTIDDAASKTSWAYLIDLRTARLVRCRFAVSQFRYDLVEAVGQQVRDFHNRIADVFKAMNDVPVIFKCFSGLDWWHVNDADFGARMPRDRAASERPHSAVSGETPGFDGLGMESYGVGEPMLTFMGIPPFGECEQATKTMWLVVTEVGEGNHQDACPSRNKLIGYTSRLGTMYANYTSLISGGAKGIFQYFLMPGRGEEAFWTDAVSRDPRQLEWLGTYARILANAPKLATYAPKIYYRFPGIFNPNGGLTFSDPYRDYYNTDTLWFVDPAGKLPDGTWVLPTFSLRPKTDMYLINLENAPASLRYAKDVEAAIASGQRITWIGYRKDRGTIPSVDRYYTGEFAKDDDGIEFQVLAAPASAGMIGRNKAGQVWNFIDGKLQIISKDVNTGAGWRPEHVALPASPQGFAYRGFLRDVLGATILDTAPPIEAIRYRDDGGPVTVFALAPPYDAVVRLGKELPPYSRDGAGDVLPPPKDDYSETLRFDAANASATYADGTEIKPNAEGKLLAELRPVDLTLVKRNDKHKWAPEGILFDTAHARDAVIVRGPAATPKKPPQRTKPQVCVWIEAETPVESNFNLNVYSALTALSGDAMLGLGTAVPPPQPDGYFAKYAIEAPAPGEYRLWIREGYLATSSPSRWRIDEGPWNDAPNTLVPHDIRLAAQYNAIDDERMMFAWYHYANVKLTAGKHTLVYSVTSRRPKGQQVGLAEARPYAKMLDCIVLVQGAFKPAGKSLSEWVATGGSPSRALADKPPVGPGGERASGTPSSAGGTPAPRSATVEPVLVNLLANPSLEYDSGGWTAAQQDGDAWKPAELSVERGWEKDFWWTYRADNEGRIKLKDLMEIGGLRVRQSFVGVRSLRIRAGEAARRISSVPITVTAGRAYVFGGYVRAEGLATGAARLELRFLGRDGQTINTQASQEVSGTTHWALVEGQPATAPAEAKSAVLDCTITSGKAGMAWFDDTYVAGR